MFEIIPLVEDGSPMTDSIYVMGHHPPEAHNQLLKAVYEYLEEIDEDLIHEMVIIGDRWGTWIDENDNSRSPDENLEDCFFWSSNIKQPESFPVTLLRSTKAEAAKLKLISQMKLHKDELYCFVMLWQPEATNLSATGYPPGKSCITFDLPGVKDVYFTNYDSRTRKNRMSTRIRQMDLEAFEKYNKPYPPFEWINFTDS